MIELLSPVGDFDCLKSAVQNGADAVYFGANSFSARAFASNFDDNTLEQAINYAKIRGVKTNLTLNTLIKNNEMESAINLAKKAYEYGIDAIIVQDLGLAKYLIKNFPGLAVHASTQMSVHNLDGVIALQNMGFSRVVLSRELSLEEIEYICKNSKIEIEVFVHGALCISYSGQCLFSSMVGGRSGNRGKCAQPCRLPYELLENDKTIDKGYLLSPRDLCGLEFLPQLINAGVTSFKIEGRMKTPEYVATVTRIYRKYIDIIEKNTPLETNQNNSTLKEENTTLELDKKNLSLKEQNTPFKIDEKDKQDLLQVFNRGGFSNGHLDSAPNKSLIYTQKSNNMGIFLGTISNFNSNNGHISFTTNSTLHIGDKICIENKKHETNTYTISELMSQNKNIKEAHSGDYIKIGRMKGEIFVGNKIYKISDNLLTSSALDTINHEFRKIDLSCEMNVKLNSPISLKIYKDNICAEVISNIYPEIAQNSPITKERLISQLCKTNNTPYNFKNIKINLEDNLYVPSISGINELRRKCLTKFEKELILSFKRTSKENNFYKNSNECTVNSNKLLNSSDNKFSKSYDDFKNPYHNKKISLLLNILNNNYDYSLLNGVDRIYIPFKYFTKKDLAVTIKKICENFNVYIYLPTIIRNSYNNLIVKNLDKILNTNKISGFVLSNIGNFELLKKYINLGNTKNSNNYDISEKNKNYELIGNYTFNVFNNLTFNELPLNTITISPELNKNDINNFYTCINANRNETSNENKIFYNNKNNINRNQFLDNLDNSWLNKNIKIINKNIEMIVFGNTPLMTTNYCLLGKTNKCYSSCEHKCNSTNKYYLKDRLGFLFRIIPDNIQTISTIYNSKITSIEHSDLPIDSVRIDILDESIDEINSIIKTVSTGKKLEGNIYTNGNFNKEV